MREFSNIVLLCVSSIIMMMMILIIIIIIIIIAIIVIIIVIKILGHYETHFTDSNYIGSNFHQILKVLFASV